MDGGGGGGGVRCGVRCGVWCVQEAVDRDWGFLDLRDNILEGWKMRVFGPGCYKHGGQMTRGDGFQQRSVKVAYCLRSIVFEYCVVITTVLGEV